MHPEVDVANLSFEDACYWYNANYWIHYGLDRLDSQDIANKLMSFLINENPYSAVRCIQRAINHCGGNVIEDGLLGVSTLTAANGVHEPWLLDRFRIEGALFYLYRVKVQPDQVKFLEGWCNRALG
jgi:lysozyme family protein